MILTDKAEIDFRDWLFENGKNNDYPDFHAYSETCKNSLIIEWLDSVGIYVIIEYQRPLNSFVCELNAFGKLRTDLSVCKSRQQAKNEAIKIANEIYNKKHD